MSVWIGAYADVALLLTDQQPVVKAPGPLASWLAAAQDILVGVAMPWLVVRSYGLGLDRENRTQWSAASWLTPLVFGFAAMFLSRYVMLYLIQHGVPGPVVAPPSGQTSLGIVPIHYFASGFYEEPVIVAVVGLLLAARRSVPEVIAVVVAARWLFHAHYGLAGLFAIAVWACPFVLLWLRYRNLLPLIAAHISYNIFTAVMSS